MTEPTTLEWVIGAMNAGEMALRCSHHRLAFSFAEEAAYYAFRAFPQLRDGEAGALYEERLKAAL